MPFLNPWVVLAIVLAWGGSVAGAFFYGEGIGRDGEIAGQARVEKARQDTVDAVNLAIARGLSSIQVKNTTIRQTLEKEVHEREVFRECRSGPAAVGMLNSTPGVAPAASAAVGGSVPASGANR